MQDFFFVIYVLYFVITVAKHVFGKNKLLSYFFFHYTLRPSFMPVVITTDINEGIAKCQQRVFICQIVINIEIMPEVKLGPEAQPRDANSLVVLFLLDT